MNMNMNSKHTAVAVLIILAVIGMFAWQVSAQQQPVGNSLEMTGYELVGSVGAGGTAVAGNYQTDVMIGQTAVGQTANGDYDLGSGFWGGGLVTDITTLINQFLPIIQR